MERDGRTIRFWFKFDYCFHMSSDVINELSNIK